MKTQDTLNITSTVLENVLETPSYVFPKYGSKLEVDSITKEHTLTEQEVQLIKKIGNGNHLGELSVLLSGITLFLWKCQKQESIIIDVLTGKNTFFLFANSINENSSIRDFLISVQKNLFQDLAASPSKATINNATNVSFSSDQLFFQETHTEHSLNIQFLEGQKIAISYQPSLLGEKFSSYLMSGLSIFLESLKDSNQKLHILSLFPVNIQNDIDTVNTPLFIEQFTSIVSKHPEATAIIDGGTKWNYKQLNELSNQLSHHIINEYNITDEASVAVLMDNSAEAYLSLIAVLKAGGTYVPIDPSWPKDRIEESFELADIKLVITQSYHLENVQFSGPIFAMDFQLEMLTEPITLPTIIVHPHSRAYILFTSGTTGTPRGVEVEHKALANMLYDQKNFMSLQVGDRLAQPYAPTFDASLLCMGVTLLIGATLIPIPKEHLSSQKIAAFFTKHDINVASFVPSVLRSLDPSVLDTIKILICGGEKILADDIKKYGKNKRFINSYGTTETTCCACTRTYDTKTDEIKTIAVGKPIKGMHVVILGDDKNPTLQGITGEVWIGGSNLARGYLKSKEETERCFINHPLKKNERLYRTGDLGRLTISGDLEIIGRSDRQFKVNGQRIEPIEIETALISHPNIDVAHIEAFTKKENTPKVIAFLSIQENMEEEEIKQFLKKRLPQNWIPNEFVQLEQLPNNAIGKIDTDRLKSIWLEQTSESLSESENSTQLSAIELQLVDLWRTLFDNEAIDASENFFSYGGHSLLAIQLLSNVQEIFTIEIALGSFLANPTIQFLATEIEQSKGDNQHQLKIQKAPKGNLFPITSSQKGFWIQDKLAGSTRNHITRCYKLEEDINIEKLNSVFQQIVAKHEALRMHFTFAETGEPKAFFDASTDQTIEQVPAEKETILQAIKEEHSKPFDLEKDPLLRIVYFTGEESYLVLTAHHIISDGWSIAIFLKELQSIYNGETVEPLTYNLRDCLYSLDSYLKSEKITSILENWKEKLQGYHNKTLIAVDFPRNESTNNDNTHRTIHLEVPRPTVNKLKSYGNKKSVSNFTILVAALAKLIHVESGETTFRFGTPNAGRFHPELESQMGCFLNLIVLQFELDKDNSLEEILSKISEDIIWSLEHSKIGFTDIVEAIGYDASEKRHPLFDIEIDYRSRLINANPDEIQLDGVVAEKFEDAKPSGGKFDFDFLFTETEKGIELDLCYNQLIYTEKTADRIVQNYLAILEEILNDPTKKLNESVIKDEAKKTKNSLRDRRKSRLLRNKKQESLPIIVPEIRTPNFSGESLVERLETDAVELQENLHSKKVVLYRGFELKSEDSFQKAVAALGDKPFDYIEKSSLRKELKQGIYTSTEHPNDQEIKLHCEHSYSYQWPQRLIFSCLIPAEEGGATTLADAQMVTKMLPESVLERFKKHGVLYVRNFSDKLGLNWPSVFKTDSKEEVEAYCIAHHIKYEWWGENNLRTHSIRPAFRKHPTTGELMWFNHSYFFNPKSLDEDLYENLMQYCDYNTLPFNTFYGDGKEIEPEVFLKIKTALNKTKMSHFWEQGDFLILDNMLAAHGRTSYKGNRKIVLAMTQIQVDNTAFPKTINP